MRDMLEEHFKDAEANPIQRAKELAKRELPKRFYKSVGVKPTEDGLFVVQLDGRTVRTPAKEILSVESEALAKAIAAEWDAQEKEINPGLMPLTRIANSAQDAVGDKFAEVADVITSYAGNDALCYRAENPDRLVQQQTELWDPILRWAEAQLEGQFTLAAGVMPVMQSDELLAAFRAKLEAHSPIELTAFHTLTTLTGSAVLALALREGFVSPDDVWAAAHVEEDWNIELWGEDAEAKAMRAYKRQEFDAAVLVLLGAE